MPNVWNFRLEARFTDARPVLDVKFDIEKRVRRILRRDAERPALVFRDTSPSYTTPGGSSTIELRLEAAYETYNLFALEADFAEAGDPVQEKKWEQNVRIAFDRWTTGLALTEICPPCSPDRYQQVMQETISREFDLAHRVNPEEDAAICVIQEAILSALRRGKSFSTAHHEGGTNIRYLGTVFVIQDYGESNDREEFADADKFLARLRQFYDWESRRDSYPHAPPEEEAWRFIERQLR
jgi:hypothetical protein